MKSLVELAAFLTMAALLTAVAAPLGGGVPAAVHYIDYDKVSATMAKGGAIVNDPDLIVLANRRGAGQVEYHEHTNHIFIMVEGGDIRDWRDHGRCQANQPGSDGGCID